MLEFFRRHRGAFLITLTIIIIISFSVWGGWRQDRGYQKRAQVTDVAITAFGKDYTIGDVQRAQRSIQFSQQFLQSFELLMALMQLGDGGFGGGQDMLINLFVARGLMEKYDIRPSDAEARAALEQIPALQTGGKFDLSRAQMLEENASSMGFEREDLLGIMKDTIGLKKLQELVTSNYVASPLAAEKQYASSYQTFKGSKIVFETDTFKKAATVTDDEIKKYYDENKDAYKTTEKRAINYVYFENPKDLDKKPLEERTKEQHKAVERVNAFNDLTVKQKKSFQDAAKEAKETVVAIPAFAQSEPPAALKNESALVEQIFASAADAKEAPDAVEGISGWYVFEVTKVEPPKQQELAEVKDKIKDVLAGQKADEARSKAVNDARTALNDGLKAGKKIEDLAKEKNLTLEALPDIDTANPPQDVPNGFLIAQQAAKTAPNTVSNAVDFDKGTLLIYVTAKELRKRPDSATVRQSQVENLSRQESQRLFNAWFKKQHEAAKVKTAVGVS